MTHRLFLAIRPPSDIRAILLDAMGGIAGARWQDDGQLHLTLRFVGEIERERANDLAEALETVRTAPFDLAISGVGTFEKRGTIHTLWAGLAPSEPLRRLQHKIERACTAIGLPPETRRYHPHVTLARLNAGSGSVAPFLAAEGTLTAGPWRVDGFRLYESHLSPDGPRYAPMVHYPLDQRPSPPDERQ